MECRSRTLGHDACLKSMSRTITIIAAMKYTLILILDSTKNIDKVDGG